MTQRISGVKKMAIRIGSAVAAVGVAGTMLALPMGVSAQSGLRTAVEGSLDETGEGAGLSLGNSLPEMVGTIIKGFIGLLGMVLVVLIIYAGFLWMTAQGNEEQVSKAKDILKNAVIGMIIMFAAWAITDFVINAVLTGTGQ